MNPGHASGAAHGHSAVKTSRQFRIFISYSQGGTGPVWKAWLLWHLTVLDLCKTLRDDFKLCVLSDRNIGAGTPFTDAIKGLITHAHLFIPLITKDANLKPWVHQETGFAMARNIPILPVVLEDAGMPNDMIAQLQAITVKADLSDLAQRLRETPLENLIFPRPAPPAEMVMIADWPEERAQLLINCANRIKDLGYHGMVRQRGAFSSFCIPDAEITDSVWREREGKDRRSAFYHCLQRQERQSLEWHATRAGCRLIIDPAFRFKERGLEASLSRLKTLLVFLNSLADHQVEVVFSEEAQHGNLTIVGDWFVAESLVPRSGGYRQTVFNWHAPTVSRSVKRFDEQFEGIAREQKLELRSSRRTGIERIGQIIGQSEATIERQKAFVSQTAATGSDTGKPDCD